VQRISHRRPAFLADHLESERGPDEPDGERTEERDQRDRKPLAKCEFILRGLSHCAGLYPSGVKEKAQPPMAALF
jgi:hypothetical protein